MIGFMIFLVIAALAVHAWLNYSSSPSTGRLILAIIVTIFALPTLIGAIFKVTVWVILIFVVLSVISLIIGPSSDKKKE